MVKDFQCPYSLLLLCEYRMPGVAAHPAVVGALGPSRRANTFVMRDDDVLSDLRCRELGALRLGQAAGRPGKRRQL